MFKKKSGARSNHYAKERDPAGHFNRDKYSTQIPGIMENTGHFKTCAKEPVQGKAAPRKRRELGVVKSQYADHQERSKKKEKVENNKSMIAYPIGFCAK
jgi:hypothetical protein